MSMIMHDSPAPSEKPQKPIAIAGDGGACGCCAPCDIPAFCRNHYYRGKLLTEREFADEQRMIADRPTSMRDALRVGRPVFGVQITMTTLWAFLTPIGHAVRRP